MPLGGRAVQIASGREHICALLDTGDVKCWGGAWYEDDDEEDGMLPTGALGYGNAERIGDDETPDTIGPVPLGGRAVQIQAGTFSTCALLDTGVIRCWGSNQDGQLGLGNWINVGDDELPSTAPTVNVGGGVVRVAAGGSNTCALLNDGGLRCWGLGIDGMHGYGHQLMIGDNESPASVGDLPLW